MIYVCNLIEMPGHAEALGISKDAVVRDVMLHGQRLWEEPTAVAVIGAWGVIGLVTALRFFRWEPRER